MDTFIDLNKTDKKRIVLRIPGKYIAFFYNLSGTFSFELNAKGIDLDIYGLYVGRGDDTFTVETIQRHNAPDTTSNLLIKGVFDERSKFHYRGLIRIEKKGQTSHAYQKNQNLILSRDAFVESEPYLEILANDVFCTHGSTTGKLSEQDLYYLRTRGISSTEGQKLLVKGFVGDVLDRIGKVPTFTAPAIRLGV